MIVIKGYRLARAVIAIGIFAAGAQASTLGPFSGTGFDASAFNVVTLGVIGGSNANAGNFSPNSDIGGAVAVYGSYLGNGYAIDQQVTSVPNPYSETYALIVNGNISTNPFTVDGTNQKVWIGGTYSSSDFNSPAPTIVTPPAASDFNFYSARTALDTLSSGTIANYSAAVTATPQSNGTNYVITPTGSGLFVYNVDASYFTNQNLGFEVDLVTGQSVIINVTGAASSLTLSKGTVIRYNGNQVNANTTGGVPVLFNLPNTTSLSTSNGSINGSILAPYATFSSPNQTVDGQLFVASVSGLAETHDQYYDGLLPSQTTTPEPSSYLLLGGALILAGLFRRTRS